MLHCHTRLCIHWVCALLRFILHCFCKFSWVVTEIIYLANIHVMLSKLKTTCDCLESICKNVLKPTNQLVLFWIICHWFQPKWVYSLQLYNFYLVANIQCITGLTFNGGMFVCLLDMVISLSARCFCPLFEMAALFQCLESLSFSREGEQQLSRVAKLDLPLIQNTTSPVPQIKNFLI